MLHLLEIWLTSRLLSSPSFHRAIRAVHRKVHELQHGRDPSSGGSGTHLETPSESQFQKFVDSYRQELKSQFWGSKKR